MRPKEAKMVSKAAAAASFFTVLLALSAWGEAAEGEEEDFYRCFPGITDSPGGELTDDPCQGREGRTCVNPCCQNITLSP